MATKKRKKAKKSNRKTKKKTKNQLVRRSSKKNKISKKTKKKKSVIKKEYKENIVKLKKGSTVLLHANVVHGSISNTSEKNRYALLLTYIKDGISFREGREAKRTKTSLK